MKESVISHFHFCSLRLLLAGLLLPIALQLDAASQGTIVVSSVGRSRFRFEIYMARIPSNGDSHRLTHGSSVNYNGQFVAASEKESLKPTTSRRGWDCADTAEPSSCKILAYVSEEEGSPNVYFDEFTVSEKEYCPESRGKLDDIIPNKMISGWNSHSAFFQDRPSLANGSIIYVGMRKVRLGQSWSAVYSRVLKSGEERCLTAPTDAADFSPSVSPSGKWVIVASDQNHGFQGELCFVHSDLYIFKAADGEARRLLIKNGGWPSWGTSDSQFFFHRQVDGWWSVYEASITWSSGDGEGEPVAEEKRRLNTPSGVHAFTPAASRDGKWVALATRRPPNKTEAHQNNTINENRYRRIEIFDLTSGNLSILNTSKKEAHQYNPFVDPDDSTVIGYHQCQDDHGGRKNLEFLRSPVDNISILRIDGDFPSFSRDSSLIAFNLDINSKRQNDSGVYVMRSDGSNRTNIFKPKKGKTFGTSWGWTSEGPVVYSSYGEDVFMAGNARIHIIAIHLNTEGLSKSKVVRLTKDHQNSSYNNNAFPSPSPDGKWIVFRSSRATITQGETHYNLYVMDSEKGEFGGKVVQLTSGSWTDTMCVWSPNGEWIAFASDRDEPGSRRYALYKMRWDESILTKAIKSNQGIENQLQVMKVTTSKGGNALHPYFSPDSKRLVFTTDYAGLSAEPISMPNMFQPFGEVYICEVDDCSTTLQRMTWSPYETGLPTWGNPTTEELSLISTKAEYTEDLCRFNDGLSLGGEHKMDQFCEVNNIFPQRLPHHNPEFLEEMEKLDTPIAKPSCQERWILVYGYWHFLYVSYMDIGISYMSILAFPIICFLYGYWYLLHRNH